MAESSVYEVRCERCQTSFAPGTKRCVHCGGPLGRGILGVIQRREEPPLGGEMAVPYEHDEDSEEREIQSRGRNLVWIITAVLAMAMSMLRTCGNG